MDSPLERKLRRETHSRKVAERLLEEKSLELYESNRVLSLALKKLEMQSESDLRKLEFKELIDAALIRFGRLFLSSTFDEKTVECFFKELTNNSVVEATYMHLDREYVRSLIRYQYGQAELACMKKTPAQSCWDGHCFHVPIILDDCKIGEIVFLVSDAYSKQTFITKQFGLVSELIHGLISRHLSLEREIELRKRAEESDQATKDFVAMINHELRTPLNGVLGSAELLNKTELAVEQTDYLNNLVQSGELLRVIINDLLDFSKMNAGMMEIIGHSFSWLELEQTLTGLFITKASEKKIDFSIKKRSKIPNYLFGDCERLTQILVNLIGNAIKFTSKGGVELDVEWSEGYLFFEVADTGIGIPPEAQTALFDPFVQADPSSKRKFEGTGLGLAICKNLVDLMEGEISFVSELHKGTLFRVKLPFSQGREQMVMEEQLLSLTSGDITGCSILVVDDIRMNQVIVMQMLKKFGIKPKLSDNGQEAIALAESEPYDLIFMDCRMPEMDGYEATTFLRERGYRKPIIALTAGTTLSERDKCIQSGMDDILTKPFTSEEIECIIIKWLGRERL
ncbi:hybrid sensor histidine kinase/response regulator [Vibrio azureus]|uniref:histidine kinase n=1 Tax=Vibrio azureus NBRC 104587 TaxID=1219077 RepID=U3AKR0_9VIBR|nr:ATP-binding protein [Vibrio azureus]AUI86033.1 hybrid sensor histidine kinase/response regulator [Vibrio azureus]GAD74345.1 putative two-component hybrid sensor and regulator [Vibrio azureus NBRC 104587]